MAKRITLILVSLITPAHADPSARSESKKEAGPSVDFVSTDSSLQISIKGKPFASYIFKDSQVLRPFFAHVQAPNGIRVTRNHPPIRGEDSTDHATLHPGIWLAFGDLNGIDYWRNRAAVKHAGFVMKPTRTDGSGRFAVKNLYQNNGTTICEETCRISLHVRPHGYLLFWESVFLPRRDCFFGDQEEMGLGVRVATPISVQKGGKITNSEGARNEKQAWGKQADWCDYSGNVAGKHAGMMLLPDPRNFRRSWFHARDYGLLVANPFGQRAFTKGQKSHVFLKTGEEFPLRFGILVYAGRIDRTAAHKDFLRIAGSAR